jgi:hypothetical protein
MELNGEIRRYILAVLIGLVCAANFLHAGQVIHSYSTNWPPNLRYSVPGEPYEPLKPYLKGLSVVGYVTDRDDKDFWYNPQWVVFLQRAQYTLSPVFLDRDQRYSYDYIIFDCERPGCEQKDAKRLGLKRVTSLKVTSAGDRVILMKRDAQ